MKENVVHHMSKVCYLIGAGEHYDNIICKPDSDDYVIAVDGGYEYALTLMVALLALAVQGGGYLSIDKALSEKMG